MNVALVSFLFVWLVVFITGLVVWVPNNVENKYKSVTVQFIIAGFTFIVTTTKFIDHLLNGEMNSVYLGLYLFSIAVLLLATTGVYYWIPKYFPEGIKDPITGEQDTQFIRLVLVSCFTLIMIFVNIYEREYSDSICKCATKLANSYTKIAGLRKLKK